MSKESSLPLYEQVKDQLLEQIQQGKYLALSRLPSEYELSDIFAVSRITIRQALNKLVQEGIVFKVHGKGTFVSKPKAYQNISQLQGFAEAMENTGHQIINDVLSVQFIQASIKISAKLKLPVKSQVFEVKRIRLLNQYPVSYELSYLPEDLGQQLLTEKIDFKTTDIFKFLEQELKIGLSYADLTIDAINADEELADLLNIAINTPILRVERLTHDKNKRPIDYEYLYFSGENFQYQLRIHR